MNPKPGKFIVIEGIDGSGKTTLRDELVDWCTLNYISVESKAFPSKSATGIAARKHKNNLPLYILDMMVESNTIGGITDSLERGVNVICDRYILSAIAYNCLTDNSVNYVKGVADILPVPDLVIYLSGLVDDCVEKIIERGEKVSVETKKELHQVKVRYEQNLHLYSNIAIVQCHACDLTDNTINLIKPLLLEDLREQ